MMAAEFGGTITMSALIVLMSMRMATSTTPPTMTHGNAPSKMSIDCSSE